MSIWAALCVFALIQMDIPGNWLIKSKRLLWANIIWSFIIFYGFFCSQYPLAFIMSLIVFSLLGGCLALRNDVYMNLILWGLCLFALAGWKPIPLEKMVIITCVFFLAGLLTLIICLVMSPLRARIFFTFQIRDIFRQFKQQTRSQKQVYAVNNQTILTIGQLASQIPQLFKTRQTQQTASYCIQSLYCINGLLQQIFNAPIPVALDQGLNKRWQKLMLCYLQQLQKNKVQVSHQLYLNQLTSSRSDLAIIRQNEAIKNHPDFSDYFELSDQFYRYLNVFEQLQKISKDFLYEKA